MRKLLVIFVFILTLLLSGCDPETVLDSGDDGTSGPTETYKVMFETNGGNTINPIDVEDGKSVLEPSNPLKEGYTFLGWYTNSTFNDSFDFTTPIVGDIKLHARWEINQYTIEFLDLDGTILLKRDFDFNADLSSLIAPINPIKQGYTFSGWDKEIPSNMPLNGVTITAIYTINQYKLQFVDYDGKVLQTESFNPNSDLSGVTLPNNPQRDGYIFNSWDISVPTTMPVNDVIITATYTLDQYTLEFVDYDGTLLTKGTFDYNSNLSNVVAPSNPTRIGYTFSTWDTLIPPTMPSNDVTITATYSVNQYSINYFDYDGSAILSFNYDFNADLSGEPSPIYPTRIGYTFSGWDINRPDNMPATDLIITATYTINQYALKYVDNDGRILQTQDFDYNADLSSVTAPIDPMRIGFTFNEWDMSVPSTMPATDLTITATYIEGQTLSVSGIDSDDYYSYSTAVEGDYIIIGTPGYNNYQGAVYVHKFSDPTYERKIIATGSVAGDNFGGEVYIYGDYIVVRAPGYNNTVVYVYKISNPAYERKINTSVNYNDFGELILFEGDYLIIKSEDFYSSKGAVYLYKFSDETYVRRLEGESTGDHFGSEILIEGDYMFIGSIANQEYRGKVTVFKFSDLDYEQPLFDLGNATGEYFGANILISGDSIFVSQHGYWNNRGCVQVFSLNDFNLTYKIRDGEENYYNDNFGFNMIIEGDYLIVSADGYNNKQGAIYIYEYNDLESPTYERMITGTGTDSDDSFGLQVFVEGDYVIVGAPGYNNQQGALFVYKLSDSTYERVITGTGTEPYDLFADSNVHVEGDYVIVGTNEHDNYHEVYLYKLSDSAYERIITGLGTIDSDFFGYNVAIEGDYIIIGAPKYNSNQGIAFIYKYIE